MSMQKKWYRLDTAALIFPAVARRDWSNAFRFSVCLNEEIDPPTLQQAVDDMTARFPSFFVTLHRGVFWYYLEESGQRVTVRPDWAYPLTWLMSTVFLTGYILRADWVHAFAREKD